LCEGLTAERMEQQPATRADGQDQREQVALGEFGHERRDDVLA
jgi:hypothetical protein